MVRTPPSPASSAAELPAAAANPLQARKKRAPLCFQCKLRKAVHLHRIGNWRKWTVFCSWSCATIHAIASIVESKFTWCVKHQVWSNHHGHCMQCDQDREYFENPPRVLLGDVREYAEGVKHE